MNVLFVSQCQKRALTETRRILDQFAERYGSETWQTQITQAGLNTVRKLLKKTARKNTAVACHWVRGKNRTELLWIVGDISAFNERGIVPTNITTKDMLRQKDENDWHTMPSIEIMAALAALFHDFGKANAVFQSKLRESIKGKLTHPEPYRHEWVSLRLFEAFVNNESDQQWLERLSCINTDVSQECIDRLVKEDYSRPTSPFKNLKEPLAKAVGWLIVTHHRLPYYKEENIRDFNAVLTESLNANWNQPKSSESSIEEKTCWTFKKGTPFSSHSWRHRANYWASKALKLLPINFEDVFSLHLARMSLMLADHYYSNAKSCSFLGDAQYPLYANTDQKTNTLKQRLDEHLVGVERHSRRAARGLMQLDRTLPRLARHSAFKKREVNSQFHWQNKAYELACSIREHTVERGFFGINMASTGCGKTFANGRIMYGLANPQKGARFSIALGLRTLTLQTGKMYRERLKLDEEDDENLAIVIGSSAVKDLFDIQQKDQESDKKPPLSSKFTGSESSDPLLDEKESYVTYEGRSNIGVLDYLFEKDLMSKNLLAAPILICTIDHLMGATEGIRGGKQLTPMLRLMSSDLILDEPDDFDLNDFPALARLVHWAGMLGSRVLLSSATLPPAFSQGLFSAYCAGRQLFQQSRGIPGASVNVCCAWFDENESISSQHSSLESYQVAHLEFVKKRADRLDTKKIYRRALIQPLLRLSTSTDIYNDIVQTLGPLFQELHALHHSVDSRTQKKVSFGLIRFANIEPLIQIAQRLFAQNPPPNHSLYLCCYHSQYPLLLRSHIEQKLDKWLNRREDHDIFKDAELRQILDKSDSENLIFIVLATAVAEVGRDHDYDWAIVEPSSMRSIIQLAGRVKRHRQTEECVEPNIYLLNQNIRALRSKKHAYCKPGFESKEFPLQTHDLSKLLTQEQYAAITSKPRILERKNLSPQENLVDLEHACIKHLMLDDSTGPVLQWLNSPAHLVAQLQKKFPFRKPDGIFIRYSLMMQEDEDLASFYDLEGKEPVPKDSKFRPAELQLGRQVHTWWSESYEMLLERLAEKMDLSIQECSQIFGVFDLLADIDKWYYHEALGLSSGAIDS